MSFGHIEDNLFQDAQKLLPIPASTPDDYFPPTKT